MSNQGDDCYFYFYSTCTKGDSCAFRHCEAALGNETVCTLWQEGRCFRQICKFRHMEIDKKRSEIPCYWENQLSGCQKANCAFHHAKGRFIEGTYFPPIEKPEQCKPEEQTTLPPPAPTKLSTAPTPQLRGVKIMEATENVPSPTHPPVVINAADDDEDDDDQFSEEGEELKNSAQPSVASVNHHGTQLSIRKSLMPKKVNLNYGIKTLKEIKFEKQDQDVPKDDSTTSPEICASSSNQINSISVLRTVMFTSKDSTTRLGLKQRLGKRKKFQGDSPLASSDGEVLPSPKKTLSERLGKRNALPTDNLEFQPKKESAFNTGTDFRIKTLEEIRQEKASRMEQETTSISSQSEDKRSIKSKLSSKPQTAVYIKSLSEIQEEKRLRQLKAGVQKHENTKDENDSKADEELDRKKSENKALNDTIPTETTQKQTGFNWKVQSERKLKRPIVNDNISSHVGTTKPLAVNLKGPKHNLQSIETVKVKTLEEIRQEKALRLQHTEKSANVESVSKAQTPSNHKKILRLSKPIDATDVKLGQLTVEPSLPANKAAEEENKATMTSPVKTSEKKQSTESVDSKIEPNAPNTDYQMLPLKDGGKAEVLKQTALTFKKRDKPKLNVEPCVVKNALPIKAIMKKKAQERTIVAEVKPMSSCSESQKVSGTFPESFEESTVDSVPPKQLKISTQTNSPVVSASAIVQPPLKSPRTSTTSMGKTSVPTEDEFDELMWDISDDKLEGELDLDSNKDEDALLLELSKMIDS
ncbi:zinc finger CCCH domain-containing protein 11A isoform X2 [Hyla sarda]|uniref:zinc finger CCCH domain-containing protein 11A isoform X2 n=1 Tax=Hyla sarda TaxID=327740 RepID=UPI0024C3DB25|nr:zinc finger CCCH domain-containing protein 11A isoform X2 [Hyla sarda]